MGKLNRVSTVATDRCFGGVKGAVYIIKVVQARNSRLRPSKKSARRRVFVS
jgi:hypothetical protein